MTIKDGRTVLDPDLDPNVTLTPLQAGERLLPGGDVHTAVVGLGWFFADMPREGVLALLQDARHAYATRADSNAAAMGLHIAVWQVLPERRLGGVWLFLESAPAL